MALEYIVLIIISYLLGSVPVGFLIVKSIRGMDIRTKGSGNIGATNVSRVLGKKWGLFCFVLDFLKGFIAVVCLPLLFFDTYSEWAKIGAAVASVAGHNWTCFLRFKGGKGVATGAGALFGMVPLVVLSCLGIWLVCMIFSRIVSLSSIGASVGLPLFMWLYHQPMSYILLGLLLACLSIYRHKANIKRILNGTETIVKKEKHEEN